MVKSDNGPPFKSKEFYHWGIMPEYSEENGEVENFMRNINRIAQIAKVKKKNWEEKLTTFLSVY